MKQISIISGKGGTGKTTITAAFASLADNAVFADCDVDAADLHLILNPEINETIEFSGLKVAKKTLKNARHAVSVLNTVGLVQLMMIMKL